jgi:MFS family permease
MASIARDADDFGFRSDGYAWYVVAVMCVGSIVSMVDRQVINLLVEPIKADLGISDTQISLLQGFAFALFYSFMAVPLGRLADHGNRRQVIVWGVVVFSLATMGCGFAAGFVMLFVARMGVGVGEATLSPAGYSMLGDYFPKHQLGRAIGLFTGFTFVGSGLALMFIGALLAALGNSDEIVVPGFGPVADWRLAFVVAGALSLGFAALMLTVREPPRGGVAPQSGEQDGIGAVLGFIRANASLFVPLFAGLPLLAAANFGLNAWAPTVFIRIHGWTPAETGQILGLMLMCFSAVGVFAGGWIADALNRRGVPQANFRLTVYAALAAAPFFASFPIVANPQFSLVLLAPALFFGAMPFGAATAAVPLLAPNRMRAQLLAVYLLIANLVGGGLGPSIIAGTSDAILGGPQHIHTALSIVATSVLLVGAALIALGLRARQAA